MILCGRITVNVRVRATCDVVSPFRSAAVSNDYDYNTPVTTIKIIIIIITAAVTITEVAKITITIVIITIAEATAVEFHAVEEETGSTGTRRATVVGKQSKG